MYLKMQIYRDNYNKNNNNNSLEINKTILNHLKEVLIIIIIFEI